MQQVMKALALVFFVTLPLFVLLSIIGIISPSSGLGKAVGIFAVIWLGAFFGMLGGLILRRSGITLPDRLITTQVPQRPESPREPGPGFSG